MASTWAVVAAAGGGTSDMSCSTAQDVLGRDQIPPAFNEQQWQTDTACKGRKESNASDPNPRQPPASMAALSPHTRCAACCCAAEKS